MHHGSETDQLSPGAPNRPIKTAMPIPKRDDEREERITTEIVVDCYNESEAWQGWRCYPIVPIRDSFSHVVVYSDSPELRQRHAERPALPLDLHLHLAQRIRRFVVVEHRGDSHTFTDLQRRPPPRADALRLIRTRELVVEIAQGRQF